MAALLNPIHRKTEGTKWGLVAYTVATLSFVTVYIAISLNTQSAAFIDNREFTDLDGVLLGPLGYRSANRPTVLGSIPSILFLLNNQLADGLLVSILFDVAPARPGVQRPPSL